jgi:hypothetical protein
MSRFILVGLIALGWRANGVDAQTLRTVLAENEIDAVNGVAGLDRMIAGFAVHDSKERFIVAFYFADEERLPSEPLHVSLLNKATRSWRHGVVSRQQQLADGPILLGSIQNIVSSPRFVYVESHLNPSASLLVALRARDLSLVKIAAGWIRVLLPDDRVVVEDNQIHFAPTHPAALSTFDPATRRTTALYPSRPPGPIRRAYIERVRQVYQQLGDDWLRAHNHHGDPEQFDSSIAEPIVVEASGRSIAFVARWGSNQSGETSTPQLDVVVVCSLAPRSTHCTESLLSDSQRDHPGWSTEQRLRNALRP